MRLLEIDVNKACIQIPYTYLKNTGDGYDRCASITGACVALHDALGSARASCVQAGSVVLDVAGQSGAVYLPGNPYQNYELFKKRNQA